LNAVVGYSRRQFLEITAISGGGLIATLSLPGIARAAANGSPAAGPVALGVFIRINPDNTVIIGARGCEIGQGVRTSLPMLLAEELEVRWDQVRVEQLDYGIAPGKVAGQFVARYGPQGAGGSTSISDGWTELRQAGAQVRQLLIASAAQSWNASPGSLTARDGAVWHADGRSLKYGELAARAAKLPLPQGPFELKPAKDFKIIGQPARVADCGDIVSGRARYGIDATLPGMLHAVIARSPTFDGRVKSFDDAAARKVRGVRFIVPIAPPADGDFNRNLAAGVAVVADNSWAALQGRKALQIEWDPGPWAKASSRELERHAHALIAGSDGIQTGRSDGDMARAWDAAAQKVEATYQVPFLAHATMEPPGATVAIQGDRVKLVASMQSPGGASRMIAAMLGIPRLNIDIELPRSGGGFGRRLENDFVAEAVMIAQQVKRPVKLLWSRDDDLANDFFRPFGVQRLRAAADAGGKLTGWSHRVAATSRKWRAGRGDDPDWVGTLDIDGFPANCVPNYLAEFVDVPFCLARGWWRAPLHTFAAFATESFVDEVAHALKRDPLELRLEMLGAPRDLEYREHGGPVFSTGRLSATLREAARRISYGRTLPQGHGIGFASHFTFGGYTSHAMEVTAKGGGGWHIERCICVSDVGTVVNPLGVETQLMGGTIDGISTALGLEITVEQGRVQQTNYHQYPLLRMPDAPPVEVHVMPSTLPPCGAGEMGVPSALPALANAIFAATGQRLRRLPLLRT
jgi:isoquinoline 1-oxidoreductase beta subunit